MPQGGIDDGESPLEAAFREMKEEIGTNNAEFLRELDEWLEYDLPAHLLGIGLHGRYRGQRQKWIAMRFRGDDARSISRPRNPSSRAGNGSRSRRCRG
jgi:putative (di)nucleoside polyphosphate hydrolase